MRICFITFDSRGYVSMDLTSDEEYLQQGLRRLTVEPILVTFSYVNEGLEKANMMIRKAATGGKKVTSIVYALTAAKIPKGADRLAAEEAQKARKMGAIVFAIGANEFEQKQLEGIADSKDHMFGVPDLDSLSSISSQVIEKSCIEIKSLEPTSVCMGESPDIKVHGRGFANALNKKDIICRFKFSRTKFEDKAANSSGDNFITCPGVEPQVLGKPIFVEISLNKGITFIANNLKFSGKDCGENPAAKPTEDKAGNPSKVNSQSLAAQSPDTPPEKSPTKPSKNAAASTPRKSPEQSPKQSPEQSPKHASKNTNREDEGTDEEEDPEEDADEEYQYEDDDPTESQGSSKFPWIPVVAGASALLLLLLLLGCLCYLCWPTEKELPRLLLEPSTTVCCSLPRPVMITRCCDCPGTGRLSQMEGRCLTFAPVRAPCMPVVCDPALCAPPCRRGVPFPVCPGCCHSPRAYSWSSRMLPLVSPCSRAQAACPPRALPAKPHR
ncbi:anthrax toxin receptor-like [Dasypus novemcinctus]|uniref:anthrax toxin receptor-like n=1 Tax=Dasypus novemcinctus TaxID=9361 RepID=UPI00265DB627|nr:anthrax toxin receptor-like [Dasypus novemcinctus]